MINHIGLDELAIQEGIRKPWETLLMMTKTAYGLYAFTHKDLEHFAALVAAEKEKQIIDILERLQERNESHTYYKYAINVIKGEI